MSDISASQEMIRLFMGFIPARAIYVAAKLGIADELQKAPRSAEELASRLGVNSDALFRILRTLSGIGVFHQDEQDRFSLTPLGETLCSDSPQSVRDYALLYHSEYLYESFKDMSDSVEDGKPVFDKRYGKPIFPYMRENPEMGAVLQAGLGARTRIETGAAIEAYDFSICHRVVDVGGGNGSFLSAIVTAYDHVTGILFDQEPAIEAAKSGRGGPLPRCDLVVGDFFENVPKGADTYVVKLVFNDWNDEQCIRILKNIRAAVADNGRLLIVEALVGTPNQPSLSHFTDLTYLVVTTGRVRTKNHFESLLKMAGFRLDREIKTASQLSYLEACPV